MLFWLLSPHQLKVRRTLESLEWVGHIEKGARVPHDPIQKLLEHEVIELKIDPILKILGKVK